MEVCVKKSLPVEVFMIDVDGKEGWFLSNKTRNRANGQTVQAPILCKLAQLSHSENCSIRTFIFIYQEIVPRDGNASPSQFI